MEKLKYILFDLDGTLTDSQEGIIRCVQHALGKFGIEETDYNNLKRFIGPPLLGSFMDFYGFEEEKAALAVQYYRERFTNIGIFENRVYEGIPELLKKLKEDGYVLAVATSKPHLFMERILEKYELDSYFTTVVGCQMESLKSQKADVIRTVLNQIQITEDTLDRAVMVGDRFHDVEGARECGIACIGVLYGYGSREELLGEGACAVAETPEDLYCLIKKL